MRDQLLAFLPHLRNFALHLTRDPARSDDLVQNTLLRAWTNLDHFQPGTNLEAWLFTIMRNSFYSEHRKRRWESRTQRADLPDGTGHRAGSSNDQNACP
jgi:RNA polymerase sigma-70 factor (ECF subfamily)